MTKFVRPKGCECAHPLSAQYADQSILRCSCGRRWVDMKLLNERKRFVEQLLAKYPDDDPPLVDQAMFAITDILNLTETGGMTKPRALEMIRKVVTNLDVGHPPPAGYLLDN